MQSHRKPTFTAMPPNTTQRAMVSQFMAVTGVQEKVALKFLKTSGWKLDQASDSYFASHGIVPPTEKGKDSLERLFENYRDKGDGKDLVGAEGTMKYLLEDLKVSLENAEMFIPLELCQVPSVGEISKDKFVEGWKSVSADTIAKQRAYIKSKLPLLSTDIAYFKRVYRFVYLVARERDQKALPLDAATTYWQVLFNPPGKTFVTATTDWTALWFEFLQAKWTKTVNKDMWNQTLEFLLKAIEDETLSFWNEDGAWPSVIDDFVTYAKQKKDRSEQMETD
ncbi:Cullin binding-domain-containing protein [Amylocarpus encephaloides]|uniref:Defective in cullin neddylation protein n=1 Tax=Amylocarpus encephaloides TaxID=45428 RepID=A0A9P7YQW9_9HELO|nr:Cullin binding-domain-containing protein [Amylocarpus encephaloides]